MQDHFFLSAQEASKDKTGLNVVRPNMLMMDSKIQQRSIRVLQCSVWESTPMQLCNYVELENHQESRVSGETQ